MHIITNTVHRQIFLNQKEEIVIHFLSYSLRINVFSLFSVHLVNMLLVELNCYIHTKPNLVSNLLKLFTDSRKEVYISFKSSSSVAHFDRHDCETIDITYIYAV